MEKDIVNLPEDLLDQIEKKPLKRQSTKISFACDDADGDCNHFLFDDYFRSDSTESFSVYDLFLRLQYPVKRNRESKLEKFKNYWENYSFYAIWRKKFLEDHSCTEKDMWKEVRFTLKFLNKKLLL